MIENLVKKAKMGDKKAFNKLISTYQKDLYLVAKSKLNSEEDVFDVIQETILTVYLSISKLKKISSFKIWLMKILIAKCNNVYKEKAKTSNIPIDDISNNTSKLEENDIGSNIEFYSLLNSLTEEEKDIIIFRYAERYKIKEIANILDINENTVRSKILRAKKKIENNIKEDL